MVAPVESSFSVLTAALATRLNQRPALTSVNVLDFMPINKDEIRTETGAYEVIAMSEGIGTFDDVVFCDGNLRFDETVTITVHLEVQGTDSMDSAPVVKRRVNELLYELFADISVQASWDKAALGLDVFDYVWFTPATQEWNPGRLQQASVYACWCDIGLEARARRSFI